ncbi:MAG TPA: hypothetical protein VJY54_00985 [Lachnospiraceae bacterium]|nr:hypothetical protein [Lachnospiraceae bacterium]
MSSNKELIKLDEYHTPRVCEKCGGVMIFKGVGEYHCEDCKAVAFDDYGKVRLYIESHRGSNVSEIEAATGVKQRVIRIMLKEGRLEVTPDSKIFLQCERCGKVIRYGRLCSECEINYHRRMEQEQRLKHSVSLRGFGFGTETATGEKRFRLEK